MPKYSEEEIEKLNEGITQKPMHHMKVESFKDESIILMGYASYKGRKQRLFYGVGVVYRVVKGDKVDMVYINFGMFPNHTTRVVFVYENHARRQILTLKKGQVCHVYGMARYYRVKYDNGTKEAIKLGIYARALQGWYVPTMLDIKRLPINDDIVSPSESEEDLQKQFESILDEFKVGD